MIMAIQHMDKFCSLAQFLVDQHANSIMHNLVELNHA